MGYHGDAPHVNRHTRAWQESAHPLIISIAALPIRVAETGSWTVWPPASLILGSKPNGDLKNLVAAVLPSPKHTRPDATNVVVRLT